MRHTDEDLCWDKKRPNVFYGMPRDNTALECNECCARTFVCVLCKARYVGDATAPEMSYD